MSSSPVHIVLAGGGTAGHVNPLLAVADAIRRIRPEASISIIGTAVGLEHDLVPRAGYELELVRLVLDNGDEATFTVRAVSVTYLCSRKNAYNLSSIRAVYLLHREEA